MSDLVSTSNQSFTNSLIDHVSNSLWKYFRYTVDYILSIFKHWLCNQIIVPGGVGELFQIIARFFCHVSFSYRQWTLPFVLVLLPIALSVLRFTDSDYPFAIFKLFLSQPRDVMSKLISWNCYFLHSSSPVFSGVHVTRSLVLCVCSVDRCLSFCTFSVAHRVVCPSVYRFWLPLWHLQNPFTTF